MSGRASIKGALLIGFTISLCLLRGATASDLQVQEIRFESMGSYGDKLFTLKIRSDGTVEYLGKNDVDMKGRRRSRISHADFRKLADKISEIRFFELEDSYDRHPLDNPPKSHGDGTAIERTFVTHQPTQIVTVVARNGTKTVKDRMGPPKGLRQLEELIVDVTGASKWTGFRDNFHDIPYYEFFPVSKRVKFRALLQHYTSYKTGDSKRISGYELRFIKDNPVSFYVEAARSINLSKFDGYIVDATGYIKQRSKMEYAFVATEIRPVRRYLEVEPPRD